MAQMQDFPRFAEYVRETLAHFHDRGYLLTHPLTPLLTVGPTDGERTEQLRRLLLEAISDLRDQPDAQPGSRPWRGYRLLVLRYLEGASTDQITRELGITDRQVRRDQHEAIEAVTRFLWEKHRLLHGEDRLPEPTGEAEPVAPPTREDALLEAELLKLGAGRPEGLIDTASVIRGALATVMPLADRRALQVRLTLRPESPPAAVNRAALRQICLGLLSYAIERASGPTVEIETAADHAGSGPGAALHLSFTVSSGRESPPEIGDDDPRLIVPRRLAQLQGGALAAERRGATLVLRLTLPSTLLTTILVIDDDPDVVRLFKRLLVGYPYRVLQANTGGRALQLARQARPRVILLDVMMLSQDGWEVLNQLKGDPDLRQIPVIVCSVLRERALAEALGAVEFLHKPVSQQALLAALERYRAS